jgi:hypothetical protein
MPTLYEHLSHLGKRLKEIKELILTLAFFAAGAIWVVNYFATRQELEATRKELQNYKCINDLSLSMLVNTQSAEFLSQVARSARKEVRTTEETLKRTSNTEVAYRAVYEQFDDQKANLDKLEKSRDDAERKRENALKKLQAIQLGTAQPCS